MRADGRSGDDGECRCRCCERACGHGKPYNCVVTVCMTFFGKDTGGYTVYNLKHTLSHSVTVLELLPKQRYNKITCKYCSETGFPRKINIKHFSTCPKATQFYTQVKSSAAVVGIMTVIHQLKVS